MAWQVSAKQREKKENCVTSAKSVAHSLTSVWLCTHPVDDADDNDDDNGDERWTKKLSKMYVCILHKKVTSAGSFFVFLSYSCDVNVLTTSLLLLAAVY